MPTEREWTSVKKWTRNGVSFEITRCDWLPHITALASSLHPYHCGYAMFPQDVGISQNDLESEIDVHGGVTYCQIEVDGTHKIGFDCAHLDDENRSYLMDVDWLTQECERMADQIEELMRII